MNTVFSKRNYPLLLGSQFLGAFGDNFLLAAILSPLTYLLREGAADAAYVSEQNGVFSAVFFVPFLLLAPLAGYLNDRYAKTTWLAGGNLLKLAGTLVGLAGILLHASEWSEARLWQLAGYALVGIGACVYSPAKYGILPEVVRRERLVKANGTVEMLTLVAILGGLAGGALLYDHTRSLLVCYVVAAGLYVVAWLLNVVMRPTPANADCKAGESVKAFGQSLMVMLRTPRLGRILLGCMIFWFVGASLRNNLQAWGLEVFEAAGMQDVTNERLAMLKAVLVVGIVLGSVLAGLWHKTGELGWTRRYGVLMVLGVLGLGLFGAGHGLPVAVGLLGATGLFAGLLIVPLNAALQAESDEHSLGKTIAVQNFCDYTAMLAGALFLMLCTRLGAGPMQACLYLAAATGALLLAMRIPSLLQKV